MTIDSWQQLIESLKGNVVCNIYRSRYILLRISKKSRSDEEEILFEFGRINWLLNENELKVVLEFMAPWSEPSKFMEQPFKEVASEFKDKNSNVKFAALNFDNFKVRTYIFVNFNWIDWSIWVSCIYRYELNQHETAYNEFDICW